MAQSRLEVVNRHLKGRPPDIQCQPSVLGGSSVKFIDKEFNYTLNNPCISREDRIFYEKNGFIVIPDLFDEQLLDECCERFAALCEGRIPKGNMTLMKDLSLMKLGAQGQHLYNKAQDILYDEVFEKYILNKKLLDVVECFTGPNIKGVHSMLINKPPDSGGLTSRHPLHQDLYYFPFRPADRIVAAWTALEDATTENGCLVVIPGTHKSQLLPHTYPEWEGGANKLYHGVKNYNPDDLIPLPMRRGQTVFFHPLLLHGSGSNQTKGFRRSISCHYAPLDCYYIDVEGTIQEEMAQEVIAVAKRKFGTDININQIWELRARTVRESLNCKY